MISQHDHYSYFQKKYKPEDSLYVGWSTKEAQKLRLNVIHDFVLNWYSELYACKNILDVGCGVGVLCDYFLEGGYTGIDINTEYIKQAKKLHPGYDFELCDLMGYKKKHN